MIPFQRKFEDLNTAVSVLLLLAIFLLNLFILLDWFTYPQFFHSFMFLRFALSAFLAGMLIHQHFAKRKCPRVYLFSALVAITFVFTLMANNSGEGYRSDYYVGVIYCLVAIVLLPVSTKFLLICLISVYATYILTIHFVNPVDIQLRYLVENHMFMSGIASIVVLAHWYVTRLRSELASEYSKTKTALTERNQAYQLLSDELHEAEKYVKTMLPAPIHEGPIHINWKFIPSASLGGDAFGYHQIDDEYFAIYLLDVSGHGVASALLSVSVLNELRPPSLDKIDYRDPSRVLKKLNMAFPREKHNNMFFTIWYGVYHLPSRVLTYADAGHPPALMFENGNTVEYLETRNFVIGGMPDSTYGQGVQKIEVGTYLYIFSDGAFEIIKKDGQIWGIDEFELFVAENHRNNTKLLDELYQYTQRISRKEALEDDFTILELIFP